MIDTKNPQTRAINQKRGPQQGNQGLKGKRDELQARRKQAESLSNTIQAAYGDRKIPDYVNSKYEGISPDNKPRKFKR